MELPGVTDQIVPNLALLLQQTILPSSLRYLYPIRPRATHPKTPVSVLENLSPYTAFHGTWTFASHQTVLHKLIVDGPGSMSLILPKPSHTLCRGLTNITPFLSIISVKNDLRTANPRLINSAEEPWFIRRCGFSPHCAATLPKTLIRTRSVDLKAYLPPMRRRVTTSSFDGLVSVIRALSFSWPAS